MKKLFYDKFESMDEFRETINSRRENAAFYPLIRKGLSSQLISPKRTDFTGTRTYEAAEKIVESGYEEPLERIKAGVRKLNAMQTAPRKRTINNVVGFVPHVPNAIAGIPQSMIDVKMTPEPTKVITLAYMKTFGANIPKDEIIQAGINMLGLVQQLELNGYRVALDVIDVVSKERDLTVCRINLKTHRQHIDFLKLTYPLVHPSMMRRHFFRWLETVPDLKDTAFSIGYGEPLYVEHRTVEKQTSVLREYKVLKDNEYVVPGILAINAGPDELIELCKIK